MKRFYFLGLLVFAFNLHAGIPSLIINEFQADPDAVNGDANGDGTVSTTQDEFVELYNTTANPLDISGWTIADAVQVRHTFPANTIIPGNCAIVVFAGGTPTGTFGNAVVQTSSTGQLGLNNDGDTITIDDGQSPVSAYTYGSEGNDNQSLTRDPDINGAFVKHSVATGGGGALFSPGTQIDGSAFSGCAAVDNPPEVTSTDPADGSTGFVNTANITINFNEIIDATVNAVTMSCSVTGNVSFNGLPANDTNMLVLDPTVDLVDGESCDLQIVAAEIVDNDGTADNLVSDVLVSFYVGIPVVEIYDIQGSGAATAFDGQVVTTENNVVTALDVNGFYMQTPDSRADAENAYTSNGIFVYTGAAPSINVGDEVTLTGEITEFFDLTEFTNPGSYVLNVTNTGQPLPAPVILDDMFPPKDPEVYPCNDPGLGLECYEGMLFDMPQGFVSSAHVGFFSTRDRNDVIVNAGSARAMREPGIEYPDWLPGLPEFDGNPELMEMNIDGLTLPNQVLSAGSEIAAKGIISFAFGDYELQPYELNVINENVIPSTVSNENISEFTIGSANVFRLYNDVDDPGSEDDGDVEDPQVYADRLAKFANYFVNDMQSPLIIGLQEVENIDVLTDLATAISNAGGPSYTAALEEGNDQGGIDVGYLYQANYLSNVSITQLGAGELHTYDNTLLHDRPPLHLSADVNVGGTLFPVNVLAVHMRSRGGINGSEADRVRNKRLEQANSVAAMIDGILTSDPNDSLYVIGDFNAFQFTDGYVDVIGQITGTAVEADNLVWTAPLFAANPLTQAVQTLAVEDQYSYVFGGSAQVLDNAVTNDAGLMNLNKMEFVRGQADANVNFEDDNATSLRSTDHDGFVLFIRGNDDVIFENGFE